MNSEVSGVSSERERHIDLEYLRVHSSEFGVEIEINWEAMRVAQNDPTSILMASNTQELLLIPRKDLWHEKQIERDLNEVSE